jgi:hypothetical protein
MEPTTRQQRAPWVEFAELYSRELGILPHELTLEAFWVYSHGKTHEAADMMRSAMTNVNSGGVTGET